MNRIKFSLTALLIAVLVVLVTTVVTLAGANKTGQRSQAKDVASGKGSVRYAAPPTNLSQLDQVKLPPDMSKLEDVLDQTFGHLITYSNGRSDASERTVWLQTWNTGLESVQIYGVDKTWWLNTATSAPVNISAIKAKIESQADAGLDGTRTQWYRLEWVDNGFGYRLISRNLTQEEVLAIAKSLCANQQE